MQKSGGGKKLSRWCSARDRKSQKGAATIEFAMAAILFFTLFFGIVDLGLMFWANLTMQHAVREGARYAITGQKDRDPTPTQGPNGETIYDRQRAVTQKIKESSMGLYDRVSPEVRVTDPKGARYSGYGNPGEIVVIRVDCTWPLLTPLIQPFFTNGKYKFTVSATMRNEAFSP